MSGLIEPRRRRQFAVGLSVILFGVLISFAFAQVEGTKPPTRHFEYTHQEIPADTLTRSLNDLDGQGWEIFQVVPAWQIKNENGETLLSPRAYEVFARRGIAPK